MTNADAPGPLGSGDAGARLRRRRHRHEVGPHRSPTARVLGLRRTPTPLDAADPAGGVVASIGALARVHLDEAPGVAPVAVGVSVPGLVDEVSGVGIFASNLGWRDAPIRALAEAATGPARRVRPRRARRGRRRAPARRRARVRRRRRARDRHGHRELAHPRRPPLRGRRLRRRVRPFARRPPRRAAAPAAAIGCLETIASAGAIARRYRRRPGTPSPARRTCSPPRSPATRSRKRVWNDAVEALAQALARLVANLAPEAIVIGGGLAQAGTRPVRTARRAARRAAQLPPAPGPRARRARRRRGAARHRPRGPRPRRRARSGGRP